MAHSPTSARAGGRTPRRAAFIVDNALSLACLSAFAILAVGMVLTGWHVFNSEQIEHGDATISLWGYFVHGHVWEALFENWESEFLQMAAYVVLTAYLVQRGSAESRDPDAIESADERSPHPDAPWPVRRGGVARRLYEHSLALAFSLLFLGSLIGHALGGVTSYNEELRAHGERTVTTWRYVTSAQFWFESFQNWQSEFLAVFAIVVLTIFLREKGSPESKPVSAPHSATGS